VLENTAAQKRTLFILLFAGFILTGIVTTILGPALPVFIARWSLPDAQAGLFFTTLFVGSLAGVGLSTLLAGWKGYRPALMAGFTFMAIGIAGLQSRSMDVALVATATFGCGFGAVSPATNLCVAESAGAQRAALLNLLNLAWGVGALSCPPLVMAATRSGRLGSLLYGIAISAVLLVILLLAAPFESSSQKEKFSEDSSAPGMGNSVTGLGLGLLFFLYVGTENGVSGWAAALAKRLSLDGGSSWTLAPMFFWATLLAGRGLAPFVLLRVRESSLVRLGLCLAATGSSALLLAKTHGMVIVGVLLAGLGLSSIYPLYIAWLSHWYGVRARRVGGIMFALAALGGATLPWMVGSVSSVTGRLQSGFFVPAAGCVMMLLIGERLWHRHTKLKAVE